MRAILMYHSIDSSGSPISVDVAALRRHAEWLAAAPVRVTGLADLVEGPAEEDAIAITFDDGFENFRSVAWPILRGHGIPVTLFIVTDHVGSDNRWGGRRQHGIPTLPLLGWDALGELAEEGVRLGSHTRSHPHLPALPPEALQEELAGSADRLAMETGRRPEAFAYPYGSVDGRSARAVRTLYRYGCTTELRCVERSESAERLPRLDMIYFRHPGRLETWGGKAFARRLRFRRAARRVRRAVLGGGP